MAARVIMEDFYMDVNWRKNVSRCCRVCRDSCSRKEQFLLRKWRSNEPRILRTLSDVKAGDLLIIDKETAKTLGLLWNSSLDTLQYKTGLPKQETVTKRIVLSKISQVFYLLGLVGPVLIRGKMFIQNLWLADLQWDQPLPTSFFSAWDSYYKQSEINTLQIPRNVNHNNVSDTFDLFDWRFASQSAIRACLYAISVDEDNNVNSQLLCAKSRVAPLKTLSLPRLELEAALLSQLCESVKTALSGRVQKVYLWSVSTIALGWIKTEKKETLYSKKTFVTNRIAKIQKLTGQATWSHVPSDENPEMFCRGEQLSQS